MHGVIDSHLRNQFKGMGNEDPPPNCVKPCPIQVLHHTQATVSASPMPDSQATIDMGWIGFFYILPTGEHVKTSDNNPLQRQHIALTIGDRRIDPFTCPLEDLDRATSSSISFDTHKNRVHGEIIAHNNSGHSIVCSTRALARRIRYIQENGKGKPTPLCAFKRGSRWLTVSSDMLMKLLRTSVAMLPHLGLSPSDLTARSLHAGGAMAFLCGRIDTDLIKLVGRWHSDAMFRYLPAQALPLIHNLANVMVRHGSFVLAPGAFKPPLAQNVIQQA